MRMKDANKTFLIALLLALFIGNITMQAQDPLQVSGTVVSKTDGEPIIGATIVETENNTNGTISDFEGKFYLSVKQGAEISVSYVGFKTQTLQARPNMKIILTEDSELLEEVVVTGYSTQRKADLTGSVAVVSTKELQTISDTDPMRALQGKVPGMTITTTGSPSGTGTVLLP